MTFDTNFGEYKVLKISAKRRRLDPTGDTNVTNDNIDVDTHTTHVTGDEMTLYDPHEKSDSHSDTHDIVSDTPKVSAMLLLHLKLAMALKQRVRFTPLRALFRAGSHNRFVERLKWDGL